MKADLIYTLGPADPYHRDTILIPKSGKYLDMDGWKPRLQSLVWGGATTELMREAAAINTAQKALTARRHALNERLRASQVALVTAAKAAPKDPPPPPPEPLDPEMAKRLNTLL